MIEEPSERIRVKFVSSVSNSVEHFAVADERSKIGTSLSSNLEVSFVVYCEMEP